MIDDRLVADHRDRALSPDHPVLRGSAQNPDVFFQNREAVNSFYDWAPFVVESVMDCFAALTGRHYKLFEYHGAPDAERVIVVMGSAIETVAATVDALGPEARVGVLGVHLFRPFSARHFLAALPDTVRQIAVLDRTKEPGAAGEPLFQDVMTTLAEVRFGPQETAPPVQPDLVIGGRYGWSKEFSPAMAKAVFDELARRHPRPRFTVGIVDDVTRCR